jgi:hypothetical protein
MSNEQSNEANQSAQPAVLPNNSPQPGNASQQQTPSAPLPPEDPFALDQRLISEIQKGGNAPEHTKTLKPEIVRNDPPIEKK